MTNLLHITSSLLIGFFSAQDVGIEIPVVECTDTVYEGLWEGSCDNIPQHNLIVRNYCDELDFGGMNIPLNATQVTEVTYKTGYSFTDTLETTYHPEAQELRVLSSSHAHGINMEVTSTVVRNENQLTITSYMDENLVFNCNYQLKGPVPDEDAE